MGRRAELRFDERDAAIALLAKRRSSIHTSCRETSSYRRVVETRVRALRVALATVSTTHT